VRASMCDGRVRAHIEQNSFFMSTGLCAIVLLIFSVPLHIIPTGFSMCCIEMYVCVCAYMCVRIGTGTEVDRFAVCTIEEYEPST
jgi:hypothetical protein